MGKFIIFTLLQICLEFSCNGARDPWDTQHAFEVMSNTIFFAFRRKNASPLERLKRRPTSEDNIKKDVKRNVWGDMDWFHQGQNKDKWRGALM